MAALFKPTRPYPLPANPEIVEKDGKPHVRIKERGKTALYPLPEDRKQFLKPASKWAADVRFATGGARLVGAALNGRVFRGLGGPDRAALYTVAGTTGLRAKEFASLSPRSFTLDGDPPVVVVEAAYSKHRRDEVPLHPELVAELRAWLTEKPAAELRWPGNWAKHTAAVDLIKRDLEVARAAWLAEARTPKKERSGRNPTS